MAQTFEGAQPQIVRGKQKFKESGAYRSGLESEQESNGREALNIMYDKRVFRGNTHGMHTLKGSEKNQTAAEKDAARIKAEHEAKKIEMIKLQLQHFKKAKSKTSPYDLNPGPPARIEVDLTYFLTEQNRQKPQETDVKCQTDVFQARPPTPQYVPKKTGIDKITQIEDFDLFDYDAEVQPILNVLLTKSVEQALLEVEEETELSEIRKFKSEYEQRQVALHDAWEEEVKREIQRIKHKNKVLKQARAKRDQQLRTMHKVQCLQFAKNFLRGCKAGTLAHLAEHSFWRDSLKDQLEVAFKQHLLELAGGKRAADQHAKAYLDGLVGAHAASIAAGKVELKKEMEKTRKANYVKRLIESGDRRQVHFKFDPEQPYPQSRFSRDMDLLLEGSLEEARQTDKEAMEAYIERVLEDGDEPEASWVELDTSPYAQLALANITNVAFAVADSPFHKSEVAKYYPEAVVVSAAGEILARVGPHSRSSGEFAGLAYVEGFRDEKLRLNDDRKVRLNLEELGEAGSMVLLLVRSFDTRALAVPEGAHANSWFRLQNESTNQTIDYTKIASVDLPDDYAEGELPAAGEDEEEAEEPAPRNELVYVAGRLFRDDALEKKKPAAGPKWVYEKFARVVTSDAFEDVAASLAALQAFLSSEQADCAERLIEVTQRNAEIAEQKAREAAEAAAKKKGKKGGKAETPLPEEQQLREKSRERSSRAAAEPEDDFDLFNPAEFKRALASRVGRPFVFGPVELDGLDSEAFDGAKARAKVQKLLEKQSVLAEPGNQICVHGYRVMVKERTLKRRSSVLKHARFLNNLVVAPVYPQPIEEEPEEGEDANEDANEDADE